MSAEQFRATISRLTHRLTLMVGRGKISASKDDGVIQSLQVKVSPKETPDLQRVGEFGLASWPPDNCDTIIVFQTGDRTKGVVIGTHDLASRFKLGNKGEVALFSANGPNGAHDKWIWFKKGGGIEVQANGEDIVINGAKSLTINVTTTSGVVLNTQGDVTANMNGKNLIINSPGAVNLTGAGGRKVVCDGDPVTGGVVHAAAGQKVTAT